MKKGRRKKKIATGYVPHRTKTMWERHLEMHNLSPIHETVHLVMVRTENESPKPYTPPAKRPDNVREIEEVLKEKFPRFSNAELRYHFGFDGHMISLFRAQSRTEAKYKKMHPAWALKKKVTEERELRMIEMRVDKEMSLEEIGKVEGITRERVRQILDKAEKKHGIELPHYTKNGIRVGGIKKQRFSVAKKCLVCGKIKEVPNYDKDKWATNFCRDHRMTRAGYKLYQEHGVEWYKMTPNERQSWRYYNNEKYRAMHKEAVRRNREQLKADPVRWAAFQQHQKEYLKGYYEKKHQDKLAKIVRPFVEVPEHDDEAWLEKQLSNLVKKLPRQDSNLEPTD